MARRENIKYSFSVEGETEKELPTQPTPSDRFESTNGSAPSTEVLEEEQE